MANGKQQNDVTDITFDTNPIEDHIYRHYTDRKQAQDDKWINYHRTNLVAAGVTDVEAQVVTAIKAVQGGKTIATALKDVPADQKPAFEKLVKIGLRTVWAKACIDEGLAAMAESREPVYPPFPEL